MDPHADECLCTSCSIAMRHEIRRLEQVIAQQAAVIARLRTELSEMKSGKEPRND